MGHIVERHLKKDAHVDTPRPQLELESPWRNPDDARVRAIGQIQRLGGRLQLTKHRLNTYTPADVLAYSDHLTIAGRNIITEFDAITDFPDEAKNVPGRTSLIDDLRQDNVVGLISHDFKDGLSQYALRISSIQDASNEEVDTTFNDMADTCLQTIALLRDPFPQEPMPAVDVLHILSDKLHLEEGAIVMSPSLNDVDLRFSPFWFGSLAKNVYQNFRRASFEGSLPRIVRGKRTLFKEPRTKIGVGIFHDTVDGQEFVSCNFLDDAGGYPDEIVEQKFTGHHGYNNFEGNNLSTGIAMRRLQNVVEKRYGGSMEPRNARHPNGKKGALLTVSFPIVR
jgi:hypothetical protein